MRPVTLADIQDQCERQARAIEGCHKLLDAAGVPKVDDELLDAASKLNRRLGPLIELLDAAPELRRILSLTDRTRIVRGAHHDIVLVVGPKLEWTVGEICHGRGHLKHPDGSMHWRLKGDPWRAFNDWDGEAPSEDAAWQALSDKLLAIFGLSMDLSAPCASCNEPSGVKPQ